MKKLFLLATAALSAVLAAAPVPDEGARQLLKKYAEAGKNYAPRSGRSAFFGRAQLKYGLERTDYLRRWTDFPLLQNTDLAKSGDRSFINPGAWKIMARTVGDYGIDGFAFFPSTRGRADLFAKAVTPGASVVILPELIEKVGLETIAPLMETALANKSVYRLEGKVVLTTYPGTSDPKFWTGVKRGLTAKFGDKFLLMPMHTLPRELIGAGVPTITAGGVEKLAGIIRDWLRHFDGYYYNQPPLNEFRRYDAAFDRDVMIPLLRGILSEPEFRNKYLAWGTKVGHENHYEKGAYTFNCGGTFLLRGTVGSAVKAGADVVNLVEWDEENENTSFRPTVANGFSTGRIMRYFTAVARGTLPTPFPGDDTEIPNVILSYRRSLPAGETLTLEVVNVPEKDRPAAVLPVRLVLKNIRGAVVRTFEGKLDGAKLDELRFNVKVADVLDEQVLTPELTVAGRTFTGFTPAELRANYNADCKWVKQPLRDLANCSAALGIAEKYADGRVRIEANIKSKTPLHHVALIDSGSRVYVHNTPEAFHETPDRVVIRVLLAAKPRAKVALKGSIRVRGAKGLICGDFTGRDKRFVVTRPDGWDLPGGVAPDSRNMVLLVCSMDRASAENAVFEISAGAASPKFSSRLFDGEIPVSDILKKEICSVAGKGMSLLLLHHTDLPFLLPGRFGGREAAFSVIRAPSLPQSVYFIEAVDVDGRTFRSAPVTVYRPSGKPAVFSAFDFFDKKRVEVRCDENLLTVQKIEISPRLGTVVKNSGGNDLTGLAGNLPSLANGLRMQGETDYYSSLVIKYLRILKDDLDAVPRTVPAGEGRYAWRFDGFQTVSFPVAMLYPYSGFELVMDVSPDGLKGTQTLFTSGNAGFTLALRNGFPQARLYRGNLCGKTVVTASGPKLAAKKTSRIVVRFDQKTLQVAVDGKKGRAVPCSGYQLYPRAVSVGVSEAGNGFRGEVSRLEIRPL